MKPITINDEEDDLAAEEENKIINEVRTEATGPLHSERITSILSAGV